MQQFAGVLFLLTYFLNGMQPTFSGKPEPLFSCGDQFGYYPDPEDCSKYYVCVFGDALHESCTGGLYFSTELQTCDWPSNSKCGSGSTTNEQDSESLRQNGDVFLSNRRKEGSSRDQRPASGIREPQRGIPASRLDITRLLTGTTTNNTTPPPTFPLPLNPPSSEVPVLKQKNSQNQYASEYPESLDETNQSSQNSYDPRYHGTQDSSKNKEVMPSDIKPQIRVRSEDFGSNRSTAVSDHDLFIKPRLDNNGKVIDIDVDDQMYNSKELPRGPVVRGTQNNGKSKDLDVNPYSRIEENNPSLVLDNFDGSQIFSDIITNNGNKEHPDTLLAYSNSPESGVASSFSNRGNIPRDSDEHAIYNSESSFLANEEALPSFSRNNGKHGDLDVLRPLSRNNGQSKNPDAISSLSRNNGHSKDPDTVDSLLNNNGHSKDPDIKTPNSKPTTPPERFHELYDQPSRNHRPAYSGPRQSLSGPDNLDAQFGTNPTILSLPNTPNQHTYNQPRNKYTSSQNSNTPLAEGVLVDSNSPLFDYKNSDDSYQYNYKYFDDYEPRSEVSHSRVSSHKPSRPSIPKPATTTISTTTNGTTPTMITPLATTQSHIKSVDSLPTLPARPLSMYPTPTPLAAAIRCSPNTCRFPDCRCGGTDIPENLPVSEVPQVVLLTFDDAVNDLNYDLYKEIFTGRRNPNGCPILGTFYVSHEWTDYGKVQTLYSEGHEMASHSISHSYGEKFSKSSWFKEVQGQREILHLYGGVKMEDIRGMRAPFLQIGGNNMFEMLYDANFTYDSSMPVFENNPPFWPYTLDYAINHECMITPCPNKSFPGLWEIGMVMWVDLKGGRCSMADACSNSQDEEGIVKFLSQNFNRHYNTNRAPFGLFYHSAWFTNAHHRKGFMKFLDDILSKDDVWLITNWQLIQWLRKPTPKSKLNSFEPWQCKKNDRSPPCSNPTVCNVWDKEGIRYMKTCQKCPKHYPWVGNTGYREDG
ncbi:uncharacterized protein LOC143246704 [Tachypleus tridentatus]|uniref:uncharacterized protein LOC143246704 n=1 Tax=Tachypleus tridentatus TaxID=6853 RepID=UPI003FCF2FE9